MRAGRWPVASLGVPHGGVDGRAGGLRSVQVGQQRAYVQGVGVPDGDLTEDRGASSMRCPGGVVARSGRMSAARDVGANTAWVGCGPGSGAGGSGTTGRRSPVRCQVARWWRSRTRAMLWRSVWGWVLGGVGACGGRGGGRGGGVGGGTAEE